MEEIRLKYKIMKLIKEDRDEGKLNLNELYQKYYEFAEENPRIYHMVVMGDDINFNKIEKQMQEFENVYNNTSGSTKDKKFEALFNTGQKISEEYLYPITGKPTEKQMKIAKDKAKKKFLKEGR